MQTGDSCFQCQPLRPELILGPVFQVDIPIRRTGLSNRDVTHGFAPRGAVPVPRAAGHGDDVSRGADFFLHLCRDDTSALDEMEHLVFFVDMRLGTRARAKVNRQQFEFFALSTSDEHVLADVPLERGTGVLFRRVLVKVVDADHHLYLITQEYRDAVFHPVNDLRSPCAEDYSPEPGACQRGILDPTLA